MITQERIYKWLGFEGEWHEIHLMGCINPPLLSQKEAGCPCGWSGYEQDTEKHLSLNPDLLLGDWPTKILDRLVEKGEAVDVSAGGGTKWWSVLIREDTWGNIKANIAKPTLPEAILEAVGALIEKEEG